MTLNEYFKLPHTPAKHSPVGMLMQKIAEKRPHYSLQENYDYAISLIFKAAGREKFQLPKVLSEEEEIARSNALKELREKKKTK